MHGFMDLTNGVRSILEAALSIRILGALDRGMARIILMLLEDGKYVSNHRFVFQYQETTMELMQGDQRRIALAKFCQVTQIPVSESWETLYDSLKEDRMVLAEIAAYCSRPFNV